MTAGTALDDQLARCCADYRALGLSVAIRGHFVELCTTTDVAVLLVPSTYGPNLAKVSTGPVLEPIASTGLWKFLVAPDFPRVGGRVEDVAHRLQLAVCHRGSVLLLPGTPDRAALDGCRWWKRPLDGQPLPHLSQLLDVALRILDEGS